MANSQHTKKGVIKMNIGNFILGFVFIAKALMIITALWFWGIVLLKILSIFRTIIDKTVAKFYYRRFLHLCMPHKENRERGKVSDLKPFTPENIPHPFFDKFLHSNGFAPNESQIPEEKREESSSEVILTPPGSFRNVEMQTLKTSLIPDDADIIYDQAECERAVFENELSEATIQAEIESNTKLSDNAVFTDSEISYSGSCFDAL